IESSPEMAWSKPAKSRKFVAPPLALTREPEYRQLAAPHLSVPPPPFRFKLPQAFPVEETINVPAPLRFKVAVVARVTVPAIWTKLPAVGRMERLLGKFALVEMELLTAQVGPALATTLLAMITAPL